ncbi:ATP-binding domain-containing protein [Cellulomonas alba]|uniref:AAA family ATPase n=1 Tax=Cellulomonas alba TaxID=3053467 RepID=A0ABT7SDQ9_9CELL|nr:ATP-binding domain-containing protein [Cellulomonas alba]MDM7853649.1 AAA family ATPase [Cellulomonas alba]
MAPDNRAAELSDERAAEKQYAEAMHRRADRPQPTQGARSTYWTGTGQPIARRAAFGELVGRVALRGPEHEHLDGASDFYIGDCHYNLDGVEIFSWAAPVACAFFRGSTHHTLCDDVAVIRTFVHSGGTLTEFHDEALVDDPPSRPFARRALNIPTAPIRPTIPRLPTKQPPAQQQPRTTPQTPAPTSAGSTAVARANQTGAPRASTSRAKTPLRAESVLQSRLAAPRAERLTSVLSTLQPDQYEIVTAPGRADLVVEGQPGTGKTIIAAHRAAYLVSPAVDTSLRPTGSVLLVGPSREYSRHVEGLISSLAPGSSDIRVVAVPEVLGLLTQVNERDLRGPTSYTWQDVDTELAALAGRALAKAKRTGRRHPNMRSALEQVYEILRVNGSSAEPLTNDAEWRHYLRSLPRFGEARVDRSLQPLLASIVTQIKLPQQLWGIGHVIVDEAQDVHPLEWEVLRRLNSGTWTIFGDLNQRRSDHTVASWQRVADYLGIRMDSKVPVTTLQRGYRSTRPIIQFANRLLPRTERELESLQREGPDPVVVPTKSLSPEAMRQAIALLDRHPQGTVAIIDVEPEKVRAETLRLGWVADRGDRNKWRKGGRLLTITNPDAARGLEFDGVVVVEPGAFPPNLGRQGQLYTALTRANRELVVVHNDALPDELRVRRR